MYASESGDTDERIIAPLRSFGVEGHFRPFGAAGRGRLRSHARAIQDAHPAYFYTDFDRWVHGTVFSRRTSNTFGTKRTVDARCVVCLLWRTERAFASHSEVQRVAERATNRAWETVIRSQIDATAGSCWISPEGAEIIATESLEHSPGPDLEWPALILRRDPRRPGFVRVEGLEFERAEFAVRAIASVGREEEWVEQTYQNPKMWSVRLQLATDSISLLKRFLMTPGPD